MAETLQPVPFESAIAGTEKCSGTYLDWFLNLARVIGSTSRRMVSVTLVAQFAAILPTAVPTGRLPTGQYRLTYYLTVTQQATTSSSVTLTLGWIDTATKTQTFAALASNSTGAAQSGSILIDADSPGVLTYSAAYASVGATPMKFKLRIVVEAV